MDLLLDDLEVRVLGSLIEKEITTPEYYPLSPNALTRACNQKNNRDPVLALDEETVLGVLDGLTFHKDLVKRVMSHDTRVPKYRQAFAESLGLSTQETAALCVLMLRGPQTLGEIRGRAERLYAFEGLDEISATLQGLMEREGGPMVARLPRRTGYKEARYAHLFSGEVQEDEADTEVSEPADPQVPKEDDRISKLEAEMAAFRQELDELRRHFAEFRKQLE